MASAAGKGGGDAFERLPAAGKMGLGAGLVLLISAIYYFALHMSVVEDIEAQTARTLTLQGEMAEARARNAEFVQLREELTSRQGLDQANRQALPSDSEMASFLQDLNHHAELSGLAIRLVEPRPEESEEHYVRLPVNLRMTGRYHQMARFFNNISGLDRLISMENIHFNEAELVGEEVNLHVNVLATTFRSPDSPNQAGPAVGPAGGGV